MRKVRVFMRLVDELDIWTGRGVWGANNKSIDASDIGSPTGDEVIGIERLAVFRVLDVVFRVIVFSAFARF